MGRPLLSTLIAPASSEPAVHVATLEAPSYERWSYLNPFDPDSDEFFEGPDVVYEAFLSPEEISQRQELELDQRIQEQIAIRNRLLQLIDSAPADERDRLELELVESSEEDSSSASSFSSGRATPINGDERDQPTADRMALTRDAQRRSDAVDFIAAHDLDDHFYSDLPPLVSPPRSLPTTPTRVSPRSALPEVADPQFSPLTALAAHASPALQWATPPSNVSPRILHWPSRPRAVNMSPSPTPNAPLGSARATLMGFADPHVPYLAPALRVHQ